MKKVSFKERVKNIVINESKNFKEIFIDYEYLVCSSAFVMKDYYIIYAKEDNYQHLTGVNSLISAQDFFDKCYNGTLEETDFDFRKRGQSEKAVKGSVRRKIEVLPSIVKLFYNKDIKVEEAFVKNRIICGFATTDEECTLGFTSTVKSRPMTLLKGNELDINKMQDVSLLLRKEVGKEKFNELIIGNSEVLMDYYETIKDHVDESLIPLVHKNEINKIEDLALKEIASSLNE